MQKNKTPKPQEIIWGELEGEHKMDKTYGPTPEQTAGQRASQPVAFEKKQFRLLLGKRQKTPEYELPPRLHPSLVPGQVTYKGNQTEKVTKVGGARRPGDTVNFAKHTV